MGTIIDIFTITIQRHEPLWHCTQVTQAVSFLQILNILIFKEMTTEKRFINFRLDGCHVTSRARRCDVTEF